MNNFTYTFELDEGVLDRTYAEYLKDDVLRKRINDPDNYKLFLGLFVICHSGGYLEGNKDAQAQFTAFEKAQRSNPLRFYAPNSQEQLDFINSEEYSVYGMIAPNRVGKTTSAYIREIIRSIPCDPKWELFSEKVGIKHHEFRGPVKGAVATYDWGKMEDPIWVDIIHKWTPDVQLGKYGRTYKGRNKKHMPSWGKDKSIRLKCGTTIGFFTYEQDQGTFEGGAYDWWLWDEQGNESKFVGANRGLDTTDGEHAFSLTPHKVKGRPDTGAGSWIHKMFDGNVKKGHNVGQWRDTIFDVPDWIFKEKKKAEKVEQWETEPLRNDDQKVLAEGRARLYGEWHRTAGLVFDEFDPNIHVIEPLWDRPPKNFTLYRGIDHGITNPTACIWGAVDEDANIFIYRDYFSRGKTIHKNVEKIVEVSGNRLKYLGLHEDNNTGVVVKQYEEIYEEEYIARQALDSRSFSLPSSDVGRTHGWIYKQAGLRSVAKASGKHYDHWIPLLKHYLTRDPERENPVTHDKNAPQIYIFNNCTNLIREIKAWAWDDKETDRENPKEKPVDKDNHGITGLGYMIQIPMRYLGDIFHHGKRVHRDPDDYWRDPNLPRGRKPVDTGYRSI